MVRFVLALALILTLIPTAAHTPMKQSMPPPNKIEQRAKQEPRRVMFEVTAYTSSDFSMNGKGVTASGTKVKRHRTIAASRGIPYGTRIYFPKLGRTYVVEDRGGAIHSNRIDIYMGSRKEALQFGRRKLEGVMLPDGGQQNILR